MKVKKRTIYLFLAFAILFSFWKIWTANQTPVYRVVTDKPIFGNPASSVVIIEFSDLQCPACKAAYPTIKQIMYHYRDQIQFRYMHFPLTNLHQYAEQAAEAAECANDFGKFYDYIDEGFSVSPDLTRSNLLSIASRLGIPLSNFTACLDSGWKEHVVAMDAREGNQQGVHGTPTIFINSKEAPSWEYLVVSGMIEQALNQSTKNN